MPKSLVTLLLGAALLLVAPILPRQADAQQAGAAASFAASTAPMPDRATLTVKGATYVPAYSSVRTGSGKSTMDLAVTLSIHNTSGDKPLVLERVDYFDTAGKLVERYLPAPVALRPFGTVEIFVAKEDIRGGTGANFFVEWSAGGAIAEPVIETVMIGSVGTTSYSFVSQGRTVKLVGEK